jgi:D-Tyr-tRNAtyr deacylase
MEIAAKAGTFVCEAAAPHKGNELYTCFVEMMKTKCRHVATGIFGAMMEVELIMMAP